MWLKEFYSFKTLISKEGYLFQLSTDDIYIIKIPDNSYYSFDRFESLLDFFQYIRPISIKKNNASILLTHSNQELREFTKTILESKYLEEIKTAFSHLMFD